MATTLNYHTIRPKIKSGDLLIWEPRSFWGYVVQFFTKSKFVHIGIAWWCYDRLWILDIDSAGGNPPRALSNHAPFYWIPCNLEWNDSAGFYAFEVLDSHYSFVDALKALFNVNWLTTNGMICSEYVANILYILGAKWISSDRSYTPIQLIEASGKEPILVSL